MIYLLSLSNLLTLGFILFLSGILSLVVLPWIRVRSYKKEGVSTYFFPIMGLLQLWQKGIKENGDGFTYAKEATKECPNPKYMVTNVSKFAAILLRDPQYIKEFLQKQHIYPKTDKVDFLKLLAGNGVTLAEGDLWKRHRKIISASFNYEFLRSNTTVVQNTVKEFLDKISPEELNNYSLMSNLEQITGEVVGRLFFGENLSSYKFDGETPVKALRGIMKELAEVFQAPPVILLGAKAFKIPLFPNLTRLYTKIKRFRNHCLKIIEDKKTQTQESNYLLVSLLATQKSNDIENRFSDTEIVDEFVNLFIAGMDTTARLVGMSLYSLAKNPKYLKELKEERDNTYNKEENVNADTLQKMDILHSVFKETLRMYTPTPLIFFRQAQQDHDLLDIKIKKGDLISPDFFSGFYDPKNFENPYEFNPARFKNTEQKLDPYAFVPFSGGPRNCIGQHLAMMEAKLIVSEFLERFNYRIKDNYQLRMAFKLMYEPIDDIPLILSPKRA